MTRTLKHNESDIREAIGEGWFVSVVTDDNKFRVTDVRTQNNMLQVQDRYGEWSTVQDDDLITVE